MIETEVKLKDKPFQHLPKDFRSPKESDKSRLFNVDSYMPVLTQDRHKERSPEQISRRQTESKQSNYFHPDDNRNPSRFSDVQDGEQSKELVAQSQMASVVSD